MKMPRPKAISPSTSHEEAFAQRYRWLMGWALRLTNGDREHAEDLVHDTFVQFMINRPDLGAIEANIDGYFYAMLRNMHVSQARRALRIRETAFPIADILSISETASVQTELRMVGQRIQVQDELCRICQYASIRKNSSKVGSVVILRFFHGYYPNEISAVARSSRAGVDKMLQRARSEARLYLKDPNSLSFLKGEEPPADLQIRFGQEPEDLLCELRDALYRSRQGECLSNQQLREAYQVKESDRVSPEILAHIVCCAVCLDEVNRLLGLPMLADREPEKMTGRDKRDRDGGDGGPGDGTGSTGDFMEKPRRRLKEVLEHRPKELRVSVNGFILGSHTINSELNRLSISAKGEDKIGFVEVFSEEEVRLLFCVVDAPPDGPVERKVTAKLSDDRSLELFLDFSDSWPSLNVTYHDPAFAAETEVLSPESQVQAESEGLDEKSHVQEIASRKRGPLTQSREWIASRLRSRDWISFLRPGTVTAVFALLLIAVIVFVQLRHTPPLTTSAEDLLQRSASAEAAIAARTDQVLHRTISLEEKNLSGYVVARRRIEVWHSAEKGITARRLYDERGVLIAGDWRKGDGEQIIYHHGAKQLLQLAPDKRPEALISADGVWQFDPSAKDFTSLIRDAQSAQVQELSNAYVISYAQRQQDVGGSRPIRATLTLSKSDLHATELTLVLQPKGTAGSIPDTQLEPVEFRFVESRFERRPIDAVAPALFEPDPDLISSIPPTRNSKLETPVAVTQPPSPVMATAALEVEVLNLLHQVGADLGEQISVTRVADGELKVLGLVDTDQRKAELLAALSSVTRNPAVKIEISTVAEATAAAEKNARLTPRNASPEGVVVERVEAEKDVMPAGPELRRYFGDEEQMRRFASRMINRSHEAMRHAGALKRLLNQFSAQDLRELDPESRGKWLALVRSHANAFQAETAALRQELQPVFFASAPLGAPQESPAITSDDELVRAVARLFDLSSANDQKVRTAFSSSAIGSGATVNSQLWGLLKSTESLAAAIQKAR